MEAGGTKKLCPTKLCNNGKGNKMKKVIKNNNDLPLDVLEIMYRKLDFDDLFQFAGVCKSWRIIHKQYWTNFMKSQSPLIVDITRYAKKVLSFHSVPDLKMYRSTMPNYFCGSYYCSSSSGYLIFASNNRGRNMINTLLLMNPFTRRKKQISTSTIVGRFDPSSCGALLAFVKGNYEEFVIVVSSCRYLPCSFNVYQSRNSSWVTYSWKVVDFVVLHNTVYVLTENAKIGVLSLNSTGVKFKDLKNTPLVTSKNLKLVACDEELLVVHFEPKEILNVYKVDLSTMEYVKLESLGDIALFYSNFRDCYALSNPSRWGYESNSVYCISDWTPVCEVYSWNNELKKCIVHDDFGAPSPKGNSKPRWLDWCFRQYNEVDYSVVD